MLNFQTVADLMPRIFPVVQQDEPLLDVDVRSLWTRWFPDAN